MKWFKSTEIDINNLDLTLNGLNILILTWVNLNCVKNKLGSTKSPQSELNDIDFKVTRLNRINLNWHKLTGSAIQLILFHLNWLYMT